MFAVIDPCSLFVLFLIGVFFAGKSLLDVAKKHPQASESAMRYILGQVKKKWF